MSTWSDYISIVQKFQLNLIRNEFTSDRDGKTPWWIPESMGYSRKARRITFEGRNTLETLNKLNVEELLTSIKQSISKRDVYVCNNKSLSNFRWEHL